MPRLKFVNFKAVRAAITMEQVLARYGLLEKLKRSGEHLTGPCPIHKGSNPTQFKVNTKKNVWNCFSECKHGGNTLDFICKMEDISIHAAGNLAIEWFNLDREAMSGDSVEEEAAPSEASQNGALAPAPRPTAQRPAPAPTPESSVPNKPLQFRLDKLDRTHPYLAERGLSLETLVDFGVGFCAKGMMEGRIAIPIHNADGGVVAYAGRFAGIPGEDTPKYKLPPGFKKSLELFNIDRAKMESADKPLVIVEGFFGCMKLHQHGYRKVVALMGSTMSAAQEELIKKYTNSYSMVIVMLDEDEAGRAGREDIAVRLSRFCFVSTYVFDKPDMQPDQLSPDEVSDLWGGVQ